jgi:DNA-binding LacI/PurR family transcriptional regulator
VESQHQKLAKLGESIPIIYIDLPLDTAAPFVGTDNRQSFRLIIDYLIRSGDAPCYFGLPPESINARDRANAYGEAMRDLNLESHFVHVETKPRWEHEKFAFDATLRILRDGSFPTKTVLCGNDRIAFGVVAAAYQAGLKVGRGDDCDLRVAGHDDQPFSRYMCPPLTTVAQNYNEIGRLATEMLFNKLGHSQEFKSKLPDGERILLNGEIMLRMSA